MAKTITIYEMDRPFFSLLANTPLVKRHPHDLDRPDPSVQRTKLVNSGVYEQAAIFRRGGRPASWQDDKGHHPRKGDTLNCVTFVNGQRVERRTPIIARRG